MASPRAFTTVNNPPTGALSNGAVVAFDVEDPTYLEEGGVLLIAPQGLKETTPVTRAKQLIILSVNTGGIVGKTVTCTVVDVPNGRTIGFGDVVDGYTSAPFGTIRTVDGRSFARTRAGIALAMALGAGEVYIPPGSAITWDTTTITNTTVHDLTVQKHPSVTVNFPLSSTNVTMFNLHGAGGLGQASLAANAAEGQVYVQVTGTTLATLVAGGLTAGSRLVDASIVYIQQDVASVGDTGSDRFCARVTSIDVGLGGANPAYVYIDVAFPKAFTTAASALVGVLGTLKRNKLLGWENINGQDSTGAVFCQYYYTEDFEMHHASMHDASGSLHYQADYTYGSKVSYIDTQRIGESSAGFAFVAQNPTRGDYSHIRDTDSWWGISFVGAAYCQRDNIGAGYNYNRAFRDHHAMRSTATNLVLLNSANRSGLCVSGQSYRSVYSNFQASGNGEAGVLLTQIGGSTNLVVQCHFNSFVSVKNNTLGTSTSGIDAQYGNYNYFSDYTADTIVDSATNFYDKHITAVPNITTAGAGTYSAANLSRKLITRNPNGAGRVDTTDTAANLIVALDLTADGQTFSCQVINTAGAAEAITIAGGANVTVVNAGQTIEQNEAATLIFRRTSSTTVSVYIVGA